MGKHKHKNKKYFQKYFSNGGCIPSPYDSRDYTVSTVSLAEAELPEEYLVEGMKVLDQGSIGSCVAHACATAMGYGEIKSGIAAHDFSRGFIYGNRRESDWQGEGMYVRQALKQLNHNGDCEYKEFPYNEEYPKVKERIESNKDYLLEKAKPFSIVNYFRCNSESEVKRTLLNQGAVVLSIPVYDSFDTNCPLPQEEDEYIGGHAMCIIGWDKNGWIIQNSWSKSWGDKGKLYLPYDYPITEIWGLTINSGCPAPEEEKSLLDKIFDFIQSLLTKLIKRIFNNKED